MDYPYDGAAPDPEELVEHEEQRHDTHLREQHDMLCHHMDPRMHFAVREYATPTDMDDEVFFMGKLTTRGAALWVAMHIGHDTFVSDVMGLDRVEFAADRDTPHPLDHADLSDEIQRILPSIVPRNGAPLPRLPSLR